MPRSWIVSMARHFLPTLQSGPPAAPSRTGLRKGSRLLDAFACFTGAFTAALTSGFFIAVLGLLAGFACALTGLAAGVAIGLAGVATGFACAAIGFAAGFTGADLVTAGLPLSGATFWLGGAVCAMAAMP